MRFVLKSVWSIWNLMYILAALLVKFAVIQLIYCGLDGDIRSGSILPQVMAWCLRAPSHYPNQCWFIINKVPWHSPEGIIVRSEYTNQWNKTENCIFKITSTSELNYQSYGFNTLRLRQNGQHFADNSLKCVFLDENVQISIKNFTEVCSSGSN